MHLVAPPRSVSVLRAHFWQPSDLNAVKWIEDSMRPARASSHIYIYTRVWIFSPWYSARVYGAIARRGGGGGGGGKCGHAGDLLHARAGWLARIASGDTRARATHEMEIYSVRAVSLVLCRTTEDHVPAEFFGDSCMNLGTVWYLGHSVIIQIGINC